MLNVLFVALGGAVGSVLRYLISTVINERVAVGQIPWGTLVVNVVGCFVIGVLTSLASKLGFSGEIKLLLVTGLCGGFTTFSTFSMENLRFIDNNQILLLLFYVVITVVCCLFATYCAVKLVQ